MRHFIAIGALLLGACQTTDVADEPETCMAAEFQQYVGQPLSALDKDELLQPDRIIGPDTAVTMDFRPERLNVEHDDERVITRIYCG
ncbi:MAG: hypothetical protein EA338_05830 [Roseinatronobacter sp.]|nr:MAG: hypothetical protein EA338_05830 [Roseinatronobacter sp.]